MIDADPRARVADVDTSSEAHRHACEVQHLANLARDSDRGHYLAGVFDARGKEAWQRLRQDVWALMQRVA